MGWFVGSIKTLTFHWVLWLPWCSVASTCWPRSSTVLPAGPSAPLCWDSSSHRGLPRHTWGPPAQRYLQEWKQDIKEVGSTCASYLCINMRICIWKSKSKSKVHLLLFAPFFALHIIAGAFYIIIVFILCVCVCVCVCVYYWVLCTSTQ